MTADAPTRNGPEGTPGHRRRNLATWEATAEQYEATHQASLRTEWKAWGLWRIPESELRVLGEVRDLDVLEYGCGAARWAIALARDGARVTGLDFSGRRLAQAKALLGADPVDVRLVQGDAERTPFTSGSFDLVFCDWGAMTFCDPARTVPEVARLLRPGGRFAFTTASPIRFLFEQVRPDHISHELQRPYFDLHHLDFEDTTDFQLPYGEWVRLFRENDLWIDALLEPRPGPGRSTTYLNEEYQAWARSWPLEQLWKLRKGDLPPERRRHRRGGRRVSGAGRRPRGTRRG